MTHGTDTDRFVLIGAGAAARALGLALRRAGCEAVAVLGRDPARTAKLAGELGAVPARTSEAGGRAALWCVCVSDGAIRGVAENLAGAQAEWTGRTVLHLSGANDSSPLDPLAALGAVTLAFHPVQTFTPSSDARSFDGISVGISGDAAGRNAGLDLAARLGLRPVIVEDADRPLVHLATALVSNGAVTLSAVAHEVLASCGIAGEDAARMLAPLVMASARNLQEGNPQSVLTGPVARGDAGTVQRHLECLEATGPHLVPVVAAVMTETVRLAVRSGRLGGEEAGQILEIISRILGSEGRLPAKMEP